MKLLLRLGLGFLGFFLVWALLDSLRTPTVYRQLRKYALQNPPPQAQPLPPYHYDFKLSLLGHIRSQVNPDEPFLGSLKKRVVDLNRSDAIVLLGDIQNQGTAESWDRVEAHFLSKLRRLTFLAVGNHDLLGDHPIPVRFGPRYQAYRLKNTLLLFLDTESTPGDLSGDQLYFVMSELEKAAQDAQLDQVMLFMHRILWFYNEKRFQPVRQLANFSSTAPSLKKPEMASKNFWGQVFPKLKKIAAKKTVHVFAGDAGKLVPLIYDKFDGIHLVATGCRGYQKELTWNHILEVYVKDKQTYLYASPLDGIPLGAPEGYTLDYWNKLKIRR